MGERFVDKIEANAFRGIITINGLQTGNLAQKWGSGQTTEYQHGVAVFQTAQIKIIPVSIKDRDVRQPLAGPEKFSVESATTRLAQRS